MRQKILLLSSCVILLLSLYVTEWHSAQQETSVKIDLEYQLGAILYMQRAAEYRALCYQAFNWAKKMIDEDERNLKKLPKSERKKPRAIVFDIDETILDNSPSIAYGLVNNKPFNLQDWYAWGEMRKAKPIPGSVEFAKYANSKGIRIFYVSNRDEVQKQATIDNLQGVGFPDVSNETVLLRQNESSKEPRRQFIASKYRIVLLMGDNLNDFAQQFEKKSIEDRFAETDKIRDIWGGRFIVLPNAMYGDWENAIYGYQRLTEEQKAQKRFESLELP